VILIPLGMYLFQLVSVINDDITYFDVVEIWFLIPIMAVIVPFVYLIRAKLFASIHRNDLDDLEEDLLKDKGFFGQLKDLFK